MKYILPMIISLFIIIGCMIGLVIYNDKKRKK